jgi:hypothetical protein
MRGLCHVLGVFAIAVTTVVFPLLAKMRSQDDEAGYLSAFEQGLRLFCIFCMHEKPHSRGQLQRRYHPAGIVHGDHRFNSVLHQPASNDCRFGRAAENADKDHFF